MELQSIVTFGGQVIIGGVLSSTKMVCTQLLELPQSSAATHVLEMVRSCGHEPATVTSLKVNVAVASQLSVAVGLPVLAGAVLAVHCTVVFAGQVITGGVLSSRKIV